MSWSTRQSYLLGTSPSFSVPSAAPLILRDWKRYGQPQGAVEVDWANPIARGLVSSINPAINDALRVGSPSFGTGERGRSLVGNGSSLIYKNTPTFGSAATILYVGNLLFSTTSNFVASIGTSGAGDQLFVFQGANGTTPPRALIRLSSGGAVNAVELSGATTSTSLSSIDTWSCVYNGTSTLNLYRNGVNVSGTRLTNVSGAMSSMDNFALGGVNRGTDAFSQSGQTEFLGLAWNRALSDAEIASISANPWQLFKPIQQKIYVGV